MAQDVPRTDSLKVADSSSLIITGKPGTWPGNTNIYDSSIDTRPHNKYGDLLNDDPAFNKRYPVWIPVTRVMMNNVFIWSVDRFIFNFDFSHISPATWKENLRSGWEWDNDHFGTNFVGHPYSGNSYFNIARSNGYNFWQSFPFAVEGSLMWEYFGENTQPSKNDIINTPISGMFLGEVLYRISSNILDDRTRGINRFWRELIAGILDPSRALNRLTGENVQGNLKRSVSKRTTEHYIKRRTS